MAAAMKAAEYVVAAQDRESGGWRYVPGEYGDTSIFGWQVMALHSAQQLGFEWPACLALAGVTWISSSGIVARPNRKFPLSSLRTTS